MNFSVEEYKSRLKKVKNSKSFDHAVIAGAKFPKAKAEIGSRDLSLKVHCN